MASHINEKEIPTIFNEIIRKRVSDYMDKELKELIKQKMDGIIKDVLSDLQIDTGLLKDMMRFEGSLIVKAIYNGQDVQQQPAKNKDNT